MTQPSASTVEEATRPPTPSPSGRLLLRMAPGLHAELARAAERDGVSLNGYITTRLAEAVQWGQPERPAVKQEQQQQQPSSVVVWALVANAAAVVLAAVAALVIVLVAILG